MSTKTGAVGYKIRVKAGAAGTKLPVKPGAAGLKRRLDFNGNDEYFFYDTLSYMFTAVLKVESKQQFR